MMRKPAGLVLVISLAVPLFGCQDVGVVTPDAPHLAKKDCDANPDDPRCAPKDPAPSATALVTWGTGMIGDGEAEILEDSKRKLEVGAPAFVASNFTATQALFPRNGSGEITGELPPECVVTEDVTSPDKVKELAELLVTDALPAGLGSRFVADLTRDVSSKSIVGFNYRDAYFDYYRWVKKSKIAPATPRVRVVSDDGDVTVLEFSEGSIVVTQSSFSPRDPQYVLVCENQDVIQVTVDRLQ